MLDAIRAQTLSCQSLGSPLYATILGILESEYRQSGTVHSLLSDRVHRALHDAIPLRFLAGLHELVLMGRCQNLARHYPSAGGSPGPSLRQDFLDAVEESSSEIVESLGRQVQTNEVGRSVVPMALRHWLGSLDIDQYVHLEVGASAGLNLCFLHYSADTGLGQLGTEGSEVSFDPEWFASPPPVHSSPATPVVIAGCDPFAIDVRDDNQAVRLLSYVWPDQTERMTRLRHAISIARRNPPHLDRSSADEWIEATLGEDTGLATVVFHSIVWQYLDPGVRDRFRAHLWAVGRRATKSRPLVWARMEPAGPTADLQVDVWDGGSEPRHSRLALIGYHGRDMVWG